MKKDTARLSLAVTCVCAAVYGAVACADDTSLTPLADGGSDTGVPATDSGSGQDATTERDASPGVDAGPVPVTIRFKAKVGTQDFQCGTSYPAQGSTNATIEPADLRFFVEDLRLLDGSGNAVPVTLTPRAPWQTSEVALLDFENGTGGCLNGNDALNDQVTGTVPAGTYSGIVFSNGVPAAINHNDPATAPPPLTAGGMTWGWLLGHLFIKAEVIGANDAGGVGLLHLGSVGCTNADAGSESDFQKAPTTPCRQQNRNEVRLTGFNPATNVIVLDVKTLFASTDLTAASMCHSGGAACPPMFASVGLDFDGGARMTTVPAFRVE